MTNVLNPDGSIRIQAQCNMVDGDIIQAVFYGTAELTGVADPTNVVLPMFKGQLFHDTNADAYYRSTGTTTASWVAIA